MSPTDNSDITNAKRAEGTDKAPDAGTGRPDTSVPGDTPPIDPARNDGPFDPTPAPAMADAVSPATPGTVATDGRTAPSEERPNNALTTIDDVAVLKGQAEHTEAQDVADAEVASQTPTKVLEGVYEPAPVVQSQDQKDPDAVPLVVSPALGVGLAEANARAQAPAPGINATVLPDIGNVVADDLNRTVIVSPEAKPKTTGDGTNAGSIDATGYVAPIRVSAAGVPASDPTLLAQTTGDMGTTAAGPETRGPGTSNKPDNSLPSTGADATTLSTNARIGGSAQMRNPAINPAGQTGTLSENESARVDATVSAMTGAPLPASAGDNTLAAPVPAGDKAAAERMAAAATADAEPAPAPEAKPVPAENGKGDPGGARATAIEAANAADKPGDIVADPYTARPLDGSSPVPVGLGGEPRPDVASAASGTLPPAGDGPSEIGTSYVDIVNELETNKLVPAGVLADVKATHTGPSEVSELDTSAGKPFEVSHSVVTETRYKVYATDATAAIQAVKDGKGVNVHTSSDDDWK